MVSSTETTILIFFVALTGIAVLLQACVLLAIYLSLRKAARSMTEAAEDLKTTVIPMTHSARALLDRITPQIITVSAGLADLTELLKKESKGVSASASEIMERVNRQTKRLDEMLTIGLNAVEKAGVVVESTVAAPVRQINGIMAAIRAVIETYRSTPSRHKPSADNTGIDPEI
jgi:hypothetical protein